MISAVTFDSIPCQGINIWHSINPVKRSVTGDVYKLGDVSERLHDGAAGRLRRVPGLLLPRRRPHPLRRGRILTHLYDFRT